MCPDELHTKYWGSCQTSGCSSKRAEPNVSRTLGEIEALDLGRLRQGVDKGKIPEVAIHRLTVDMDTCAQHDRVAVA